MYMYVCMILTFFYKTCRRLGLTWGVAPVFMPRYGFSIVWKRNWNRLRGQMVRQCSIRQHPTSWMYTWQETDRRRNRQRDWVINRRNSAPPKKQQNRKRIVKRNAPGLRRFNWRNTAILLRQSEKRTRRKILAKARHTKKLAKLGSSHTYLNSTTGLLKRTKAVWPTNRWGVRGAWD